MTNEYHPTKYECIFQIKVVLFGHKKYFDYKGYIS